jgi:hypothetical protein
VKMHTMFKRGEENLGLHPQIGSLSVARPPLTFSLSARPLPALRLPPCLLHAGRDMTPVLPLANPPSGTGPLPTILLDRVDHCGGGRRGSRSSYWRMAAAGSGDGTLASSLGNAQFCTEAGNEGPMCESFFYLGGGSSRNLD